MITAPELKEKFVNFFLGKQHHEIPSASLLPDNDSTTLFISAGMHPLVPYLLGQPHSLGKKLVNVQKCVRTDDIDEVGDSFHHTFFEMLGNWSLGDYFKEQMIPFSCEFLIKILKLDVKKLEVTCFAGNQNSPKDELSASIWEKSGIPKEKIKFLVDNWWGPAGTTGPCGPDTEMFFNGLEIWNDVFMEFNKNSDGSFTKLKQQNVDTGMGVERTLAVISGLDDNYLTSIWQLIIKKIENISEKKYSENLKPMRIIADHIRSAVFIIAAGVEAGNKEAGYVLRRLIRRAIRQGKLLNIETNFTSKIAESVLANQHNYAGIYPELNQNQEKIFTVLEAEENKFRQTLNNGLREIQKLIDRQKSVSGIEAFNLYQSYGFPVEMVEEELQKNSLTLDLTEFNKSKAEHQKQSQTLSAGKFKSGLADNSEIIIKYHTATHLLHAALRQILGASVQQSGSNITADRLRFDFSHGEKLTDSELQKVANLVNQKIAEKISITCDNQKFTDAQKQGALAFFGNKYPEFVSVYTIGDFSKEVCTGPHINNTSALGRFKIIKEESAGSGKRRIYAVLE
ncbi:MAG: alanine--tRNA ligase [Candidatus Shapirobacteria bacterium]